MNINNLLESKIRELNSRGITSFEYENLYENIGNERLITLFSWIHGGYINLFRTMNERLPTGDYEAHFWAEPSRELIFIIEQTIELQSALKKTEWAFSINEYYDNLIKQCRDFLSNSGGSRIPPHMDKIELYYLEPIFHLTESITVNSESHNYVSNLKAIGEGSYAKVFKYRDEFYNQNFVVKRAKKELTEKELFRFKQEFEQMESLNSPYIVKVYSYIDKRNEYIMEYMDCTLEKYVDDNNMQLTIKERKNIILQLIRGYEYLHSKGMLHRDVSIKNVLVKKYESLNVYKISDFGLVKIPESDVTSVNTELKGSLNDPSLKTRGFANYDILDEIYALTLLFSYILSGKKNPAKIDDKNIRKFMDKGTNADRGKRYQSLDELKIAAIKCVPLSSVKGEK